MSREEILLRFYVHIRKPRSLYRSLCERQPDHSLAYEDAERLYEPAEKVDCTECLAELEKDKRLQALLEG